VRWDRAACRAVTEDAPLAEIRDHLKLYRIDLTITASVLDRVEMERESEIGETGSTA